MRGADKQYRRKTGDHLFRLWKKGRKCDRKKASISKEDAKRAGRPSEIYVRPPIPSLGGCPCSVVYPIVLASLPPEWNRLAKRAKKIDCVDYYFTCNCQGRVVKSAGDQK